MAYIDRMSSSPAAAHDRLVEMMTQSADYAVVLLDAEGRIDGWTGSAPSLFGYAAEEALGQDYALLFVPEDLALDLHRHEIAVAAASRRSEDDRWHLRKDGSRFWGSGVLQAFGHEHGEPLRYCKMVRDRSDVRTRTQSLENEVERLALELRRRTEMTATVAHELRAPLTPIRAAADLLSVPQDAAAHSKCVEVLKRQVGILARHLQDLYEASRASAGGVRLDLQTLLVNEELQAAVDDAAPHAAGKRIDLRLVVPSQPLTVEADPQRLQQMVQNLVGNALKYTPEGGRVVVSATLEGSDLVIRVEDNGAGIDPAVLPRMFELFTREDRAGEPAWPEGLGIGLALVKSLAHLHGGTIEGRSLGRHQGSVFSLRLPLTQAPSDGLRDRSAQSRRRANHFDGRSGPPSGRSSIASPCDEPVGSPSPMPVRSLCDPIRLPVREPWLLVAGSNGAAARFAADGSPPVRAISSFWPRAASVPEPVTCGALRIADVGRPFAAGVVVLVGSRSRIAIAHVHTLFAAAGRVRVRQRGCPVRLATASPLRRATDVEIVSTQRERRTQPAAKPGGCTVATRRLNSATFFFTRRSLERENDAWNGNSTCRVRTHSENF